MYALGALEHAGGGGEVVEEGEAVRRRFVPECPSEQPSVVAKIGEAVAQSW